MMNLMKRFERYLESNGIMKKFAAKYIGMNYANFSKMMSKELKIPPRYWEAIIKLTHNAFTLEDFIEYHKYIDKKKLEECEKRKQDMK